MKKTLIFCLCFLITLSLFACDGNDTEQSITEASENEASAEVSTEQRQPTDIKINGVSLKEFTLVYCESTEYDGYNHYRLLVDEINAYLKDYCGYTLKAVPDTQPETEKELLIGFTQGRELSRAFNQSSFEASQYSLVVKGTKVMLAGAYANGWHYAFEKFKAVVESDTDKNIDTDFMTNGNEPVVKVACVGDSITQGINSTANNFTYPAYLQEMLGWEYCVLNAGISGYAVCNTDPYAYVKSMQYTYALRFKPDVVIFALGTNDSNPQDWKDWSDAGRKDLFLNSAREILDTFYAQNDQTQVYICLPTPLYAGRGPWDAVNWNANIEKYSLPLLVQIAEEYELPQIDLHTWGKQNDQVFTDGLHPYNASYKPYAKAIYDAIKDTVKKPA